MSKIKKHEIVAEVCAEIYSLKKLRKNVDISLLCSVMWNLAKGTRSKDDVKDTIVAICPQFFEH